MPPDHDDLPDPYRAVLAIHAAYARFAYTPQHNQWTILASFFLTRRRRSEANAASRSADPAHAQAHAEHDQPDSGNGSESVVDEDPEQVKIISLATGTKCLPASRLSPRGEAVHDCHAEVLARRAALRWFLEETRRMYISDTLNCVSISTSTTNLYRSPWLMRRTCDGKTMLRPGVQLNLYVSTIPCGDASMRYLAALQDPAIAILKDAYRLPSASPSPIPASIPAPLPLPAPATAARGRDDYLLLGVLRTKPGRADSPPTRCMACSDKLARWAVLGIQGALGSLVLAPIYVQSVVVGVQDVPEGDLRGVMREDCERAFAGRLEGVTSLPEGYALHAPKIHFTDVPFIHARSVLGSSTSCNESLCWTSDSGMDEGGGHRGPAAPQPEILINGLRRGVSPKHRYREKSRPAVSRIALFTLATQVHALLPPAAHSNAKSCSDARSIPLFLTPLPVNTLTPAIRDSEIVIAFGCQRNKTYSQLKHTATAYQAAKRQLVGPGGRFAGWVETGEDWQRFDVNGEVVVLEQVDKSEEG